MVYKTGKLKGQLTTAEIRKLVREHNKLVSIKIPAKSTREQIIKLINDKGYEVDHNNERLKPLSANIKGKVITRKADIKLADVPKPKKRKFKIDKSKQPKQTPSKINIKIKPASNTKKIVPKGSHRMPDGSIMKNSDMKKENETRQGDKVVKPAPPKIPARNKKNPPPPPPRDAFLLLKDKKKGQKIKQPVKSSIKEQLVKKDKKKFKTDIQTRKQNQEAKKPYKPSAESGTLKDRILKLTDYFVEDKNKIGNTFKTIAEVNTAIGSVFSEVKNSSGTDALGNLGVSERKYFIRLMNAMLSNSTTEATGVEVTKKSLKNFKGWYSENAVDTGKKKKKEMQEAPAKLEKKLLKKQSQIEDRPAIREREQKQKQKKAKKQGVVLETFEYEEVSGHSTDLKRAIKILYKSANEIINRANKMKPADLVESVQKTAILNPFNDANSDAEEVVEGNEDDEDKLNTIYEELDQKLEDEVTSIVDKNRAVTGWKPPTPPLKRLQARFNRLKKEGKDTSNVEETIIKFYSKDDVPK